MSKPLTSSLEDDLGDLSDLTDSDDSVSKRNDGGSQLHAIKTGVPENDEEDEDEDEDEKGEEGGEDEGEEDPSDDESVREGRGNKKKAAKQSSIRMSHGCYCMCH